jgi:ketosteroid isomerase-like protein
MHDGKLMNTFTRLFLLIAVSSSLCAQNTPSQQKDVQATVENFIHAFDNLDWEAFRLAFDDNATVFYPRAFPERANGRAEFEKTFKVVFQQIRSGKTAAPYMDIQPKDIKVQMLGDSAIVSFHLDDRPGLLNRRTIVLTKTNAGWKIVQLHASEVSTTTPLR